MTKLIKNNKKSKKGFTLAEVLITLAVIGVVAAISIPTLQNNINDQKYYTGLKKFYADLSSAMETMQIPGSEYTIPENLVSVFDESMIMRDNLCSLMSCTKKGTVADIWGPQLNHIRDDKYRNYKSSELLYTDIDDAFYAAVLNNGMYIAVHYNWEARKSFQMLVDTNGSKKPNMMGMDVYMFEIVKKDNGYYLPVPAGGPGTNADITKSTSYTCEPNNINWTKNWPCTFYRLYKQDQMP